MSDYDDLSDSSAVAALAVNNTDEVALTFLEVSINGGDIDTVRSIALDLLSLIENGGK